MLIPVEDIIPTEVRLLFCSDPDLHRAITANQRSALRAGRLRIRGIPLLKQADPDSPSDGAVVAPNRTEDRI